MGETMPDGVTTLHIYDAAGNETTTRVENPDGILATSASTVYNKHGQAIQVTDSLGAVTKYAHDNRGNTTKVEDALGGVVLYTYNYYDQTVAEVSPANYRAGESLSRMARTEYTYDAIGRILAQTNHIFDGSKLHSTDWPGGFHTKVTAT